MNTSCQRNQHDQDAAGDQVPSDAEIQATADFILNAGADTGKDEVQETADLILSAGRARQGETQ